MAHSMKNKGMPADKEIKEPVESTTPTINYNINAPKYGTVIPNRVFVGGISSSTTEDDLAQLFSNYGTVVNSKIILDRAGISKGYGFVTFETDEEAKRIQSDADNIVLKERKLNIAPAIKKQVQSGYGRTAYDSIQTGNPPVQNQIFRQANGITYTFLNGMAYFPHQAPQAAQPLPGNHIEQHSSPIYSPVGTYSSNSGHNFPYGYAPQGHVFYHPTQYPYPIQQFDGCYQIGENHNGVVALQSGNENGSLIPYPQYYLTQQQPSQPELTYYQQQGSVQPLALTQEPYSMYPSPRGYDSTTVFYSEKIETPPKIGTPPPKYNPPQRPQSQIQQTKPQPQPSKLPTQPKEENKTLSKVETPVVSLSKMYHNNNDGRTKFIHSKKKLPQRHLNNNSPTATNRNVGKKIKSSTIIVNSLQQRPYLNRNQSSSMQVPQYQFLSTRPYHSQGVPAPSYYPAVPRRTYYHRNKYSPRSKINTASKWCNKDNGENTGDDGIAHTLTPPITPRSNDIDTSGTQTDEVVESMQTLSI